MINYMQPRTVTDIRAINRALMSVFYKVDHNIIVFYAMIRLMYASRICTGSSDGTTYMIRKILYRQGAASTGVKVSCYALSNSTRRLKYGYGIQDMPVMPGNSQYR